MDRSIENQALALAGVMHATWLVRQVARTGRVDDRQMGCALQPVFVLDPSSVDEVYGGPECRHSTLTLLKSQLGANDTARDVEVTRYSTTILHLERKLASRDDLLRALREGLEGARPQLEHFPLTHENVIARLADLYSRTVSTLSPRVMVQGEPRFLEEPNTANRVRALLLAAIRSAVLWRQCGGSRLRLILGRQRLVDAAHALERAG